MARRFRWIGVATALTCLASSGVAYADSGCPQVPTSRPFERFDDSADYALAPGGGFEAGAAAWTTNGNQLVTQNEKYFVRSSSDTRSLSIQPGTSVESPPLCVDASYPTLRLFARKLAGAKGNLKVQLVYTDLLGIVNVTNAGSLVQNGTGDYTDWAPSPILKLGTALPLGRSLSSTVSVRLRISADNEDGAWAIDDVYVDPYRCG